MYPTEPHRIWVQFGYRILRGHLRRQPCTRNVALRLSSSVPLIPGTDHPPRKANHIRSRGPGNLIAYITEITFRAVPWSVKSKLRGCVTTNGDDWNSAIRRISLRSKTRGAPAAASSPCGRGSRPVSASLDPCRWGAEFGDQPPNLRRFQAGWSALRNHQDVPLHPLSAG
jgi:hypothetical protein